MTHIQIEVSDDQYERLRILAEKRGLSIKEALEEATELWIEGQEAVDQNDLLFTSIEELRNETERTEPKTDGTDESDLVEEWSGHTDGIRLADPDR